MPGGLAAKSEGDRGILRSLIGVVNDGERLAPVDRHIKRVDHELFPHMVGHGPTDDATAEDVENDGKIQEPAPGRDVGDVGDPQLVRSVGGEATFHEIERRSRIAITNRRRCALAPRSTVDTAIAHQTGNSFSADTSTIVKKFCVNSRTTVRRTRTAEDRFNSIAEQRVFLRMFRRRPRRPSVIAARRNLEDAAHRSDGIIGLVRFHESEDRFGRSVFSRANQAAAFERISRSNSSCLTRLRSRAISARSSVVKPSLRVLPSSCACLTQLGS
jgi:hypothetical protein